LQVARLIITHMSIGVNMVRVAMWMLSRVCVRLLELDSKW